MWAYRVCFDGPGLTLRNLPEVYDQDLLCLSSCFDSYSALTITTGVVVGADLTKVQFADDIANGMARRPSASHSLRSGGKSNSCSGLYSLNLVMIAQAYHI